MRDFFLNPATLIAVLVLVLGTVFTVTGCKTTGQTAGTHLIVSYAAAKYIEQAGTDQARAARASRVVAVAGLVDTLLSGNPDVTVDALRVYVLQHIPSDLSPADRILANALLEEVIRALRDKIGDGVIPADKLVNVRDVLRWITEGAAIYLPPSTST